MRTKSFAPCDLEGSNGAYQSSTSPELTSLVVEGNGRARLRSSAAESPMGSAGCCGGGAGSEASCAAFRACRRSCQFSSTAAAPPLAMPVANTAAAARLAMRQDRVVPSRLQA